MIHEKTESPMRRRAMNMVWNAAGRYDFDPLFLFFYQDGTPDFYMNSIAGYVFKWMDPDIFAKLFDSTEGTRHQDMYDGLIWLGLENWAYEKEAQKRPVLSELRLVHAEEFFARDRDSSMQQWLSRDSLSYMLQSARWRTLLGKTDGLLSGRDRALYKDLAFSGSMTSEEVFETLQDIFKRYLPFKKRIRTSFPAPAPGKYFSALLPFRMERAELSAASGGEKETARSENRRFLKPSDIRRSENAARIRAYLEECFGKSLYGEAETNRLEHLLCTDRHSLSRLFFTDGERLNSPAGTLADETIKDIAAQAERNRAHYKSFYKQYETSIKKLSQKIKNALFVCSEPSMVRSKNGCFNASLAWRAVRLEDDHVFFTPLDASIPEFSVDLMLDASSSRADCQEQLAAQAHVITRSLKLLGIPVQVYSFQSLRGYTVIHRFCKYGDLKDSGRIFHYCSAGWNRDGLALKAAGHLMEASPSPNRLLLVLTDANPNDDEKIPVNAAAGRYFPESYSGDSAAADTREEVLELKKKGVHVVGILTKDGRRTDAARKIFGETFVRIKTIEDLSDTVGDLLQRQIRRLHEMLPPE